MTFDDTIWTIHGPPQLSGKCHPACLLLPEMTEGEYQELVDDLRDQPQRHSIIANAGGDILDGRHRWRALQELGGRFVGPESPRKPPLVNVFRGTEEQQVALIMSENVKRRHLTTQQRAAVAAELAEKLAEAAKTRQLAGTSASPEAKGKAAEQAAKLVGGVSRASVERAIARKRTDPEAHAKAKAGELAKARPPARRQVAVEQEEALAAEAVGERYDPKREFLLAFRMDASSIARRLTTNLGRDKCIAIRAEWGRMGLDNIP